MERSDTQLPRILLVDNDPGRIEYLENLLYRHGYQIVTTVADTLTRGLEGQPNLVVSYVPLQPGDIAARGIPVLMMVPESTVQEYGDASNPTVVYLSRSAGSEELIDNIGSLIGPEGKKE